jgi:hypothetical protein
MAGGLLTFAGVIFTKSFITLVANKDTKSLTSSNKTQQELELFASKKDTVMMSVSDLNNISEIIKQYQIPEQSHSAVRQILKNRAYLSMIEDQLSEEDAWTYDNLSKDYFLEVVTLYAKAIRGASPDQKKEIRDLLHDQLNIIAKHLHQIRKSVVQDDINKMKTSKALLETKTSTPSSSLKLK